MEARVIRVIHITKEEFITEAENWNVKLGEDSVENHYDIAEIKEHFPESMIITEEMCDESEGGFIMYSDHFHEIFTRLAGYIRFTTNKAMRIEEIIEVLMNELDGDFPTRIELKINEDLYEVWFAEKMYLIDVDAGELIICADYSEYGLNPEDTDSYCDIEYASGAIIEVL